VGSCDEKGRNIMNNAAIDFLFIHCSALNAIAPI
jgi:hypothetical protein